jgi:hypothetical protein
MISIDIRPPGYAIRVTNERFSQRKSTKTQKSTESGLGFALRSPELPPSHTPLPPIRHDFHALQHLLVISILLHRIPLELSFRSSSRNPKMAVSRNLAPQLLLLLGLLCSSTHAYQMGDAVPVARRGQFHGVRLIGTLNPHFPYSPQFPQVS